MQKQLDVNWKIRMLFHKSQLEKVKKKTGAHHVIHVHNFRDKENNKINCLYIKGERGEAKFGGLKPFNDWTEADYQNASKSYINEFEGS